MKVSLPMHLAASHSQSGMTLEAHFIHPAAKQASSDAKLSALVGNQQRVIATASKLSEKFEVAVTRIEKMNKEFSSSSSPAQGAEHVSAQPTSSPICFRKKKKWETSQAVWNFAA